MSNTPTFRIITHEPKDNNDQWMVSRWKHCFKSNGLTEATATDSSTVTLVVSSKSLRSTLASDSALTAQWSTLLANKEETLLFVVDDADSLQLKVDSSTTTQTEPDRIWTQLKTAAIECFKDAAEAASAIAALHLLIPEAMFTRAIQTKDEAEAMRLLTTAADMGLCEAAWEAAVRLHEGKLVKQDLNQAAHFYKQAASTDKQLLSWKREAEQVLAQWYARGTGGVEQDLDKSIEYCKRAQLHSVVSRRKSFPSGARLCLSNQYEHTPEHSLYISCSREFDSDWAQLLQVGFSAMGASKDWAQWMQPQLSFSATGGANLSAYVVDICGTGNLCTSRPDQFQGFMAKLFEAEQQQEQQEQHGEEGSQANNNNNNNNINNNSIVSTTNLPRSHHFPLDSLHPDDISAIQNAHSGILTIITPFALKLMQLRFKAGLPDPLFLEWQEIIRSTRKNPSQTLLILKLPSHSNKHELITGFKSQKEEQLHPAIDQILKELEQVSGGGAFIDAPIPFSRGYHGMNPVAREIACNIAALHLGTKDINALEALTAQHYAWHTKHPKSVEPKIPHSLPTVFSWFPRILSHIDAELSKIALAKGIDVETIGQGSGGGGSDDDKGRLDNNDLNWVLKKRQFCFTYADLISRFPEDFAASVATTTKYLEIAARLRHYEAQARFAQCIEPTNPSLALEFYESAASQNEVVAIFRLAECWESGSGVVGGIVSMEKAVEYYQKAEKLGHTEAGKRAIACLRMTMSGAGAGAGAAGGGGGGPGSISGNRKRDVLALYRLDDGYTFPDLVRRIEMQEPPFKKLAPIKKAGLGDNSNDDDEDEQEGIYQVINNTGTDQGIKELGQALKELNHSFCVSGILPISAESPVKILFEQDSDKQRLNPSSVDSQVRKIVFPLVDVSQVEGLIEFCSPASFGFNSETVLDDNYRKALKLDGSCLATTLDVYASGIIKKIKKTLVLDSKIKPSSDIHAELHKLNVYGPEGFFKAHVDTPISADMFGSLVVCLPVAFEGGVLTVRRGELSPSLKWENLDSSKSFDWGASTEAKDSTNTHLIQWAAFFSDCPHEISPIVSGTRITLTYNLFKRNPAEKVLLDAEMSLPRDCTLLTKFKTHLSEQSFFEHGAVLMFHCQHAYQVAQQPAATPDSPSENPSAAIDCEALIPLLKGADMSVFEAAFACGLQVFVKPLYEASQYTESFVLGTQFMQFEVSKGHQYGWKGDYLADVAGDIVEVDNKKVVWFGTPLKMNRHEYLHYGNEATVDYVYSSAVIMVHVPSWKDRQQQFMADVATAPAESSPTCNNVYVSHADEFDAEWADPLRYYLKKHGVLAYVYEKQNQNGISRNQRAEKLILEPLEPTTKVPKSCLSRERSEQEKAALSSNATIIVVISPASLKLMSLRLAAGLPDHLLEEWKEIIKICNSDTSRKLVLLKTSESFQFEAEGEIAIVLDGLVKASQAACISANVKRKSEISASIERDVVPEIMGVHLGRIQTLIDLTDEYFEAFSANNWEGFTVVKTREDLLAWLSNLILPYLEAKIVTNADGESLRSKLNARYTESAHQYASLLSKIPEQKETYLKYLKIVADGNHSQTCSSQYTLAKELEVVDPELSLVYYEKANDSDHPMSAFRLGELWESGSAVVGGHISLEKAVEYYRLAGKHGHAEGESRELKCSKAIEDLVKSTGSV
ncbi:hypothetical protein BDR26DRAFT_662449 [Obelidium mucronatum]|nr:hypothetical protein BDR26DRAFT_662449 [Obelidium mucronatum]